MLQLLIIRNFYIGFLSLNCIFLKFLILDPTQPHPPKTENFVTQPNPWVNPTRPVGGPDQCPTPRQKDGLRMLVTRLDHRSMTCKERLSDARSHCNHQSAKLHRRLYASYSDCIISSNIYALSNHDFCERSETIDACPTEFLFLLINGDIGFVSYACFRLLNGQLVRMVFVAVTTTNTRRIYIKHHVTLSNAECITELEPRT